MSVSEELTRNSVEGSEAAIGDLRRTLMEGLGYEEEYASYCAEELHKIFPGLECEKGKIRLPVPQGAYLLWLDPLRTEIMVKQRMDDGTEITTGRLIQDLGVDRMLFLPQYPNRVVLMGSNFLAGIGEEEGYPALWLTPRTRLTADPF